MKKNNYKIGDKVRIIKFPDKYFVGIIGMIIDTICCDTYPYEISVQSEFGNVIDILIKEDEIEPAFPIKGNQFLLFEL